MIAASILGILFGFVAQRSGFCGTALVGSAVLVKDGKGLRGLLVTILVSMLGFALLAQLGWIVASPAPLRVMAAAVGGALFGVGMVLGGGCVSGSLYKAGEGRVPSMLAVLGIAIGAEAVRGGCLSSARRLVDASTHGLPLLGGLHEVVGTTFSALAGTLAVTGLLALCLFHNPRRRIRLPSGVSLKQLVRGEWPLLHSAMAIGLIQWAAALSSSTHERNYGLGVLGGLTGLFSVAIGAGRNPDAWDMWFVVGIPVGAACSAFLRRSLQLRSHEPGVLVVCFLGGLLTGAGAALGRGCFIGNTVTGLALLSVHSLVFTVVMILANWATTITYVRGWD